MKKKQNRWTAKEEEYLFEKVEILTIKEISQYLDRTRIQVVQKIYYMKKIDPLFRKTADERRENRIEGRKREALLLQEKAEEQREAEERRRLQQKEKEEARKKLQEKRALEKERLIEEEREKKRVQAIYEKALNEDVISRELEGIRRGDLRVRAGKTYEVKIRTRYRGQYEYFAGKLIQQTNTHITLRNKNRAETFLKVDFLINELEIKEVG